MRLSKTIAALLGLMPVIAKAGVIAGPVINPDNGHVYYLLDRSSWTMAEAEAVRMGGHLATVRNEKENTWLLRTFGTAPSRSLWIGLNDAAKPGLFVWSSGEPVTYVHWGVGEPNGMTTGEFYVHICDIYYNTLVPGDWNDVRDIEPNRFGVVEVAQRATTAPTTQSTATTQPQAVKQKVQVEPKSLMKLVIQTTQAFERIATKAPPAGLNQIQRDKFIGAKRKEVDRLPVIGTNEDVVAVVTVRDVGVNNSGKWKYFIPCYFNPTSVQGPTGQPPPSSHHIILVTNDPSVETWRPGQRRRVVARIVSAVTDYQWYGGAASDFQWQELGRLQSGQQGVTVRPETEVALRGNFRYVVFSAVMEITGASSVEDAPRLAASQPVPATRPVHP